MKLLQFELYGDYAHFKKFYTTSSPLTFSFPPPPTIKGMIGAILGIDKTEYLNILNPSQCKVGVSVVSQVKRVRVGLNHINTKGGYWGLKLGRTQIRTELLKDPRFIVYVWLADETLLNQLENYLTTHQSYFTLSLGLSEYLADFRWIGSLSAQYKENVKGEICSIIPIDELNNEKFHLESGKHFLKERIPVEMSQDRVVSLYQDVLLEANGQSFHSMAKRIWNIGSEKYVYLF
jgi:CRISPR-associated protein Cas5h